MNLHTIETGFFKLDGGAMFGVVPKTIWQNLNPPDADNLCTWAMRCLLIENGNRLVLIDTGLGDKQNEKFFSYYQPHGEATLAGSLKKLGFSTTDITDVILTHLHFDHCGGAVRRNENELLVPTFENATYWSHKDHWNWAVTPNAREKASFLGENFLPLESAGQLRFVDLNQPFAPWLSFYPYYGHTEAMLVPIITYKEKKLAYMADLLPSVAHLPVPYVMAYDVRPLISLKEKAQFLSTALAENFTLFFEHDKSVECCSLKQTERGIRADQEFSLKNWL